MTGLDIAELKCRVKFLELINMESGERAKQLRVQRTLALKEFATRMLKKEKANQNAYT